MAALSLSRKPWNLNLRIMSINKVMKMKDIAICVKRFPIKTVPMERRRTTMALWSLSGVPWSLPQRKMGINKVMRTKNITVLGKRAPIEIIHTEPRRIKTAIWSSIEKPWSLLHRIMNIKNWIKILWIHPYPLSKHAVKNDTIHFDRQPRELFSEYEYIPKMVFVFIRLSFCISKLRAVRRKRCIFYIEWNPIDGTIDLTT